MNSYQESLYLIKAAANDEDEFKRCCKSVGIEREQWERWVSGDSSPNQGKVNLLVAEILRTENQRKRNFIKHISRAKHLNQKLSDTAIAPDNTLHEIIEESLDAAIAEVNQIKH